MKWTGKVVGGVVGMLAGGPWGAALGAVLGHQFDEGSANGPDPDALRHDQSGEHIDPANGIAVGERFFRTTFEVMGHVAKSDGRVSEEEIRAARAVMSDFHLDASQVQAAIACFSIGKEAEFDLSRAVMRLRQACAGRPDLLRVFLEIQVRASIAGSDLRGPARGVLTRVAAMLGVGAIEFAHIESILRLRAGRPGGAGGSQSGGRSGSGSAAGGGDKLRVSEAYEILEAEPTASDEEVIKSYRRQLSRHHPDKLKANGLPESMLEHAKQRTQQIIEAWEVIRAERGLR